MASAAATSTATIAITATAIAGVIAVIGRSNGVHRYERDQEQAGGEKGS
jgi:hypothetical protein